MLRIFASPMRRLSAGRRQDRVEDQNAVTRAQLLELFEEELGRNTVRREPAKPVGALRPIPITDLRTQIRCGAGKH